MLVVIFLLTERAYINKILNPQKSASFYFLESYLISNYVPRAFRWKGALSPHDPFLFSVPNFHFVLNHLMIPFLLFQMFNPQTHVSFDFLKSPHIDCQFS